MKRLSLFLISGLVIVACKTKQEQAEELTAQNEVETSVIKPLEGFESNLQQFTVDAVRRDTILLDNGGSIIFGENSFVDKNGNPVEGAVDIAWEEFHSFGDIITSGIPMKYDSAGVAFDLVSGGMFSISASQNNERIEIAPGKTAEVNLVSLEDTPCYNFYELDEKSGDWDYQTTKEGEKMPEETTAETIQEENSILDVRVDTRRFLELEGLDIVGWKTQKPLKHAEKKWLKANYANTRLTFGKEQGWYSLNVKTEDGDRSFDVQPYLMEEAVVDSKKNSKILDEEFSEILAYQRKAAAGKVVRSIEIPGFGTYNWDIICKRENSLPLFANFEFPGSVDTRLVNLFLISPEENAVVRYDPAGDSKFSFDPALSNCLVAIMPDNSVMSVSNSGFDQARNLNKGASHTFNFEMSGIKLKSAKDINKYIDALI